ncbi:MAG TPA: Na+/H+ antiporter subunit E [Firmicutes bacterium]|nr:Na+/H+ antiporter subunit E [Bacillota bacterium]
MGKRSVVLFALLLIFWLVVSAEADLQHLLVGSVLALLTVWFWRELIGRWPQFNSGKELLYFARCLLSLFMSILESSVMVAKTVLLTKPAADPVVLVFRPPLTTNWGRVFLANSITIAPGSVTVDIDPDTGVFTVHALTKEIADGVVAWKLIPEIRDLELLSQRRAKDAVATNGALGLDPHRSVARDYRSHGS